MNEHAASSVYPLRVEGELDGRLSRWLWLVKWVLVIPHIIALVFLWIAFVVLTVVAFFAILFAGRYPRAIFDFKRRGAALDLARGLLLLQRAGHRPLPAVHARRGPRLSGAAECRV